MLRRVILFQASVMTSRNNTVTVGNLSQLNGLIELVKSSLLLFALSLLLPLVDSLSRPFSTFLSHPLPKAVVAAPTLSSTAVGILSIHSIKLPGCCTAMRVAAQPPIFFPPLTQETDLSTYKRYFLSSSIHTMLNFKSILVPISTAPNQSASLSWLSTS